MKKLIALLLALVLVVGLVACGDKTPVTDDPVNDTPVNNEPSEEPSDEPSEEPSEDEPAVVEPTGMTYAEFLAAPMDSEVTVVTYVQAYESWWDGAMHLYCQDEEGAYYVYGLACTEEEAAQFVPGTKILVTGYKGEWSGEVEIMDATAQVLEGNYIVDAATDATALLGTDELATVMNHLVAFKGLTVAPSTDAEGNEVAYLYKWDGSGSQGDDLYFNVAMGDQVFTFTVNVYMNGTGADSEVYKTIEGLQVGDVIDVEGFLYWYNGAQPHLTSVTVVG